MERRTFLGLSAATVASAFGAGTSVIPMRFAEGSSPAESETLNPNTKWLLEAKWGLFSHLLPRLPGERDSHGMTEKMWNQKVDSFHVSGLADQLERLKTRYFFITVGEGDHYFCSPNSTWKRQFGADGGACSERDLIAELAEELLPRGIKLCASLPALGANESAATQEKYQQVIAEWSERWGSSISAWWVGDGQLAGRDAYAAYTGAFKAGNRDALIAYNTGPLVMTYRLKEPSTDQEDFFAGQVDWVLPTPAIRAFDQQEFWIGPDYHGTQLHFLSFLGESWGRGDPRFPEDLVLGWTELINNYSGTVTWDVPLNDSGLIPGKHVRQLAALRDHIADRGG